MKAASKAAARFEAEVHEAYVQERIDDGHDEATAGDVERVFSADDFVTNFRQFLQLRLDRKLLLLLGLEDYEADIMRERIKETWAKPEPPPKMRRIQVGNAEVQQIQHIKRTIDRRRGKNR